MANSEKRPIPIPPNQLKIYLAYHQLEAEKFIKIQQHIVETFNMVLALHIATDAFSGGGQLKRALFIHEVHTGNSLELTWEEGWMPKIKFDPPVKLALPTSKLYLVVGLLLIGLDKSLDMHGKYLNNQKTKIEIHKAKEELAQLKEKHPKEVAALEAKTNSFIKEIRADTSITQFAVNDTLIIKGDHTNPR